LINCEIIKNEVSLVKLKAAFTVYIDLYLRLKPTHMLPHLSHILYLFALNLLYMYIN